MKRLFEIGDVKDRSDDDCLLMEWAADGCAMAHYSQSRNRIGWLQLLQFEEGEESEQLLDAAMSGTTGNYRRAVVSIASTEAVLTPLPFADSASLWLENTYPYPNGDCRTDRITEWQLVNAWAVANSTAARLGAVAEETEMVHAYTPFIKTHNGYTGSNQIAVHFTSRHFRVLVKKNGAVQLAQIYAYKTPLDVVYYLLKISSNFELQQEDVQLVLSGLVDEKSALYKEVLQYFSQVTFAQAPALSLPANDLPAHYFTAIYQLAACVS